MPSATVIVAVLLLAGAAPMERPATKEPPSKAELAERASLARLWQGFAADRLCEAALEVELPSSDGGREPLQIPLRGSDTVTALAAGLAEARATRVPQSEQPATPPKPTQPTPPKLACRLVLARDPSVAELERRGRSIQAFLAEDGDAKTSAGGEPSEPIPEVLRLTVGPSGQLGLATPEGWGGGPWTLEAEPLRKLLTAAVRAEAARSAEIWGDSLPYGLARSRLAEGLALAALGDAVGSREALRACVGLCRKHRRWPFLERAAADTLTELEPPR